MNFNKFIDRHWNIFLLHVCKFHPLDQNFLKKYEYELDWNTLSKNRNLAWTEELLERYEDRFLWHELAWNESIIWTTPLIKRFKKRLDWYYLGRNPHLPITAEFIEEHRKKIFIIETNIHLTEELTALYGKDLLPDKKPTPTVITEAQIKDLENTILTESDLMKNLFENLYTEFILPNINQSSLEAIFESKFDYSQRYFRLKPIQKDLQGLTPEFKIDGKNVFNQYRESRGLFEIKEELHLINGSLQEGPPRLYEVPRFNDMTYYAGLLVSQNVKNILEKFKISKHKFIPVKITPKKIKTDLRFFILQVEHDSLLKQADFSELAFKKLEKEKWLGEYTTTQLKKGEIKDYPSIDKSIKELKSKGISYSKFVPKEYIVDTDEDIFTIDRDIIVNEFVKKAMEDHLLNQVLFESVQHLNIRIPQENYDSNEYVVRENMSIQDLGIEISEEFTFYSKKMDRLRTEDLPFSNEVPQDEFSEIQVKLNVIIPEAFKQKYRKNDIDPEEYEFIPVEEFYLENEYANRLPETYKSLMVADNGCGDALGLILEQSDDCQLRAELFEFNHETGEVEEY